MAVYLIHFLSPLGHAQHYMGYARDGRVHERLAEHLTCDGAKIMQEVRRRGIGWECVRVWQGYSRQDERRLKNRKNASKVCPVCNRRLYRRRTRKYRVTVPGDTAGR